MSEDIVMIISLKQIHTLIELAHTLATSLHMRGLRNEANNIDKFLTEISLQQPEELKELE